MNDIVIAKSASTKYVEVTVTHNLNWDQHCDNINFVIRLIARLVLLRRVLADCSTDVKSKALLALCGTHILNGIFTKSSYNPGQKSSGQYCDIHIFLSFVGDKKKKEQLALCIIF